MALEAIAVAAFIHMYATHAPVPFTQLVGIVAVLLIVYNAHRLAEYHRRSLRADALYALLVAELGRYVNDCVPEYSAKPLRRDRALIVRYEEGTHRRPRYVIRLYDYCTKDGDNPLEMVEWRTGVPLGPTYKTHYFFDENGNAVRQRSIQSGHDYDDLNRVGVGDIEYVREALTAWSQV